MTPLGSRLVTHSGIAGALIGGALSAAKNIRDCNEQTIAKEEAVGNVVRDAAGSGLATAAGVFAVGVVGFTGWGALLIATGATAGAKYFLDSLGDKKKIANPVEIAK